MNKVSIPENGVIPFEGIGIDKLEMVFKHVSIPENGVIPFEDYRPGDTGQHGKGLVSIPENGVIPFEVFQQQQSSQSRL